MSPLTMPAQLTQPATQNVLSPGTYSQLVLDTLGSTDPNNTPAMLGADNAAVLLSQAGSWPVGADDDLANLGSVQPDITQQNGTGIAVQLTAAVSAVTSAVNDFVGSPVGTFTPTTPAEPVSGQGTTPASTVTYIGAIAPGSATPVSD